MNNSNVFTVLIPYNKTNRAKTAFHLPENVNWFYKATKGVIKEPIINS